MNNWQEWVAGTIPTDSTSVLKLYNLVLTNGPAGLVLNWQSVSNRSYFVQRAMGLIPAGGFSTIASSLPGQVPMQSFLDTTATNTGPYFYRVGVQ